MLGPAGHKWKVGVPAGPSPHRAGGCVPGLASRDHGASCGASGAPHVDAVDLLGIAFLQQKKFEAAEQQIGMAITMQPMAAAAHYNRGLALLYLERHKEALASFDSAIALNPNYDLAITQRENILKRQ